MTTYGTRPSHDNDTISRNQPGARVAVIDDDIVFIRMLERMFDTVGVEAMPLTSPDLDELSRLITATRCDAAIIDLHIYDKPRGFAIVDRLRAVAPAGLPIVIATGDRRLAIRNGALIEQHNCALLLKPFDQDQLVAALDEARGLVAAQAADQPLAIPGLAPPSAAAPSTSTASLPLS